MGALAPNGGLAFIFKNEFLHDYWNFFLYKLWRIFLTVKRKLFIYINICKFWIVYKIYEIRYTLNIMKYIYIMRIFIRELENLYLYFNMNIINLHYFLFFRIKLK